jgi:hypothetical protein
VYVEILTEIENACDAVEGVVQGRNAWIRIIRTDLQHAEHFQVSTYRSLLVKAAALCVAAIAAVDRGDI